jgi:aspartate carbamoyltransferase catalytic subunit
MTRQLLSVSDLSVAELLALTQPHFENTSPAPCMLRGTLALLFEQPSLRTVSSFAKAGTALGLAPVAPSIRGDAFRDQADFLDEILQLGLTSDCVVVRSAKPLERGCFTHMRAPLVNAGDGDNEHPTQAVLDITTMRYLGATNPTVVLVGNLKDHRVHHSLALGLARMGWRTRLVSPPGFELPAKFHAPEAEGISATTDDQVDEALAGADFVYLTPSKYWNQPQLSFGSRFSLDLARAQRVLPSHAKVLHPFPRFGELAADLDHTTYDAYHLQTSLGPRVRARLLSWVTGQL